MNYKISRLEDATVFNVYLEKDELWLDPPYQRAADIWPREKKQLLIDSILNGFDIPKFYFHDFYPGKSINGRKYRFAIIDGKQRLDAIWGFIDGEFPLSDDIEMVNQPELDVRGLTYAELGSQFPRLKSRFDSRALAVVTIQADDTELIEEMFSRLNEAVPLSAAEKRNALRGPIPPVIRRLADHKFFKDRVPFSNSRYRHFDLICKFLLLGYSDGIVDLKKAYLDEFVIEFREEGLKSEARSLEKSVKQTLERMSKVFVRSDELLRPIGMVTLYFLLYEGNNAVSRDIPRSHLERFDKARRDNRVVAEKDVAKADYRLLEFDRLAQSPNDAVALEYRFDVLHNWISRRRAR